MMAERTGNPFENGIEVRCPGCRHLLMVIWHSGQNTPMRIVTACKYCPKSGPDGRRARVAITFSSPPTGRKVTPLVAMVFTEEFPGPGFPQMKSG
jgi:hypothetical protein